MDGWTRTGGRRRRVPASQLYVHTDGDSWDYMLMAPVTTPAQDDALEAAGRGSFGIEAGPRASIDFRKNIMTHTDTFVRGPMSAADYLTTIGEK